MNARRFTDEIGFVWEVWSVRPDGNAEAETLDFVPHSMRDGWLVFARGMERRRLAPIPEGWWRAPEDELMGFCERADTVRAYLAIPFPVGA
jgi:hypothetical protein